MAKKGEVFERYELKYILTREDYEYFKEAVKGHMQVDQFGISTIQSIYYDTKDSLLIRRSLDKPIYKEKLRLRSYGLVKEGQPCFLEMKRKAEGLVYKRRISMLEQDAMDFMNKKNDGPDKQIARELKYFRDYYGDLEPKILIIYERESYFEPNGGEVRVSFDFNPRFRTTDLNLHTNLDGRFLLDEDTVLLEIKVLHNMPLWLTKILSEGHIKKGSFSKYGQAYKLIKENENKKKEVQTRKEGRELWSYSKRYSPTA